MKRICKSCGAKIPKNKSICKKCGEAYVDIEMELELDEETKALVTVEKKSNMIHVCILLLSILVFLYSLLLIYLHFTNKKITKEMPSSEITETEEEPEQKPDVNYNAVSFIGGPFSEVKSKLGDQYSIKKVGDQTLACYINYPVVITTNDSPISDSSVVIAATVTGNGSVSTECTADMTYSQLRSILNITKMELSPDKENPEKFSYTHLFANDSMTVTAKFTFDTNDVETPCAEVYITNEDLNAKKKYGIVTGLDEGSSLNVRSEALYDADALTQIYEGDKVEILDKAITEDGTVWYQITVNNITGFSVAEFIVPEETEEQSEPEETEESSEEKSEDNTEDEVQG